MTNHVIGYTNWEDFLKEAEYHNPDVIRVQAYYHTVAMSPVPMLEFEVMAAFSNVLDLHVFRVSLGRVWEPELERDGLQERFRRRMAQAEEVITHALTQSGFVVRRGIFDAARDCRVKGSAEGLWTWEGKGKEARIVPNLSVPDKEAVS